MRSIRMIVAGVICMVCVAARSADVVRLYEAAVPPTNDSKRDSAYLEAFRMVAVKVSGSRGAAGRFTTDVPSIRNNVQLRAVRPDGAVTIRFDEAWVDKTLTNAGLPLWGRERPAVLVWLSVPDASGKQTWMSIDRTSPEKDSAERVAQERGLPILWPQMDVADTAIANNLSTSRASGPALLASGERYRADAVLLGIGSRDASGTTTVRWSFALEGGGDGISNDIPTAVEQGVDMAADRCAQLFGVTANARTDVFVSVVGVQSVDAYASTMSYLQGLTVVLGVAVEQMNADSMRLRVAVRGDAGTLRRAVELKRRVGTLVVDTAPNAAGDDSLKFKYLQ